MAPFTFPLSLLSSHLPLPHLGVSGSGTNSCFRARVNATVGEFVRDAVVRLCVCVCACVVALTLPIDWCINRGRPFSQADLWKII